MKKIGKGRAVFREEERMFSNATYCIDANYLVCFYQAYRPDLQGARMPARKSVGQ